jgi:ABC-type multidrug transport system fused ATPase/permease subunit
MKKMFLEHKGKFALFVFSCVISVFMELASILIFSLVFETVERNTLSFLYFAIKITVVYLIVVFVLFVIVRLIRNSFLRDRLLSVRIQAFDKIMKMSYKQFNMKSRDVYTSNLINDVNRFGNASFNSLISIIYSIIIYISALTILAFLNWPVALIIFGVSVLVMGISKLSEKKTVALQKDVSTNNEVFTVDTSNIFAGLEILKLNNIEDAFLEKNKKQIKTLEKKKFSFNVFNSFQTNLNERIGYFVLIGLIVYLMYQTKTGHGYGEMMLTILLSNKAIFPMVGLFPQINVLKSSQAIYDKITSKEEFSEENGNTQPFVFKDKISVNHVNFAYEDKSVFKSISFSLEKGKKHLVKGPSGSGKSTLFKLLSHMLDDYEGDIDVDGINMNLISTKSFYEKVSFVYQDVFLFEASLKENITLFKPYSDEEVLDVCRKAGLTEFVDSLDDGIDTMIAENGKNLSGGERQRVSIARALCKKAEILFIDEATSALNEELGRGIEKTILNLDATVIAISHKHFKDITNHYDTVLEIKDGYLTKYDGIDYFSEDIL